MNKPENRNRIHVREIGPDDWPVISELFGERGACGGCWCMHWRREKRGKAWEELKGEPNKRAFKKLIESDQAHGIVAFSGDHPIGWCSFGRRSEFPRLLRTKAYQLSDETAGTQAGIWSVNCLFLDKSYRNMGVSQLLVDAAVKAIRKRKGKVVEAYPVTLTQDGQKLPAAFAFTGPEIIYQRLGFKEVQRLARSRPLYRLELA
ncbi:MAG: GNAT family N-acetyltransferase [Candidatus Zixiibacteriota bacterium]